jgi:hypothetical protein
MCVWNLDFLFDTFVILRRMQRDVVVNVQRSLFKVSVIGICTLTQNLAGGKIEKNEMGGACGAYGGGESCARGSGGED